MYRSAQTCPAAVLVCPLSGSRCSPPGGTWGCHKASWFGERNQEGAACAHGGVPMVRWVPGNPRVGWQSSLLSCWGEIHF